MEEYSADWPSGTEKHFFAGRWRCPFFNTWMQAAVVITLIGLRCAKQREAVLGSSRPPTYVFRSKAPRLDCPNRPTLPIIAFELRCWRIPRDEKTLRPFILLVFRETALDHRQDWR
jgi:hypothetical protein